MSILVLFTRYSPSFYPTSSVHSSEYTLNMHPQFFFPGQSQGFSNTPMTYYTTNTGYVHPFDNEHHDSVSLSESIINTTQTFIPSATASQVFAAQAASVPQVSPETMVGCHNGIQFDIPFVNSHGSNLHPSHSSQHAASFHAPHGSAHASHSHHSNPSLHSTAMGAGFHPGHSYHSIPPVPPAASNVYYISSPEPVEQEEKFKLPEYDPSKMKFLHFSSKILVALMKKNKGYLLYETETTPQNQKDSLMLALELYDKVRGSARLPFSSLQAQHDLLLPGKGVEMPRILANKFHKVTTASIRKLENKLNNIELADSVELSDFINEIQDINAQLTWSNQGLTSDWLFDLVLEALRQSRYAGAIKTLLSAHATTGKELRSIDSLVEAALKRSKPKKLLMVKIGVVQLFLPPSLRFLVFLKIRTERNLVRF